MKDKIIAFFDDVYKEMGKVTWPSREELVESTKIVVVTSLIIAAFAWAVDYGVSYIMKSIL